MCCFIDMEEDCINRLHDEVLARFLMGECTEEELREVNAWLQESEEHARELFALEEIYQLGKADVVCGKNIGKAERLLFKRLEREKGRQLRMRQMHGWMRYAAMVVMLFLLGGMGYAIYWQQNPEETLLTVTARDQVKELMLPDGTKVWLNRYTMLKYPSEFSGKKRKVYLEGEGFFEVKHNPEKPFVVQSEAMQVRVLGTVFNLKSNKASMSAVATLVKGEIEVKGNHDEGMIILSPGQRAELDGNTKRLVVKQVDTGIENWHDNSFVFQNADILTIARMLENSYGVKIILAPDLNTTKTYSGTLKKKENVKAVLDLIKLSIPIRYKIVGSSVFLSLEK